MRFLWTTGICFCVSATCAAAMHVRCTPRPVCCKRGQPAAGSFFCGQLPGCAAFVHRVVRPKPRAQTAALRRRQNLWLRSHGGGRVALRANTFFSQPPTARCNSRFRARTTEKPPFCAAVGLWRLFSMQFYSISSSSRVWCFLWTTCFFPATRAACSALNTVRRGPLLLSWQVNNLQPMAFSVDKCAVVPKRSTALCTGGCALLGCFGGVAQTPGRSFCAHSGRHFCHPPTQKKTRFAKAKRVPCKRSAGATGRLRCSYQAVTTLPQQGRAGSP